MALIDTMRFTLHSVKVHWQRVKSAVLLLLCMKGPFWELKDLAFLQLDPYSIKVRMSQLLLLCLSLMSSPNLCLVLCIL